MFFSSQVGSVSSSSSLRPSGVASRSVIYSTCTVPGTPGPPRRKSRAWRCVPDRKAWKFWLFLAAVCAVAIAIPVGWSLRVHELTFPSPTVITDLQLFGNLVAVDPVAQTLTIDWEISYNCGFNTKGPQCMDVDIYFDRNLLQNPQGESVPFTNDVPTTPIFHINGTVWNNGNLALLGNSPFFRTLISLFDQENRGSAERTLQAYPFDRYGAQIFLFARNSATGEFFNISLTQVTGIAPGFSVTPASGPLSNKNDGKIYITLNVLRATVVRVYVMTIIIAIWLITLLLFSATIISVILGRVVAKEILVIPVTTLFAFTLLRGTLPGAPTSFGSIIDFMGILPCLSILTFCAVLMMGALLFRSNPDKEGDPLWKIFFKSPRVESPPTTA